MTETKQARTPEQKAAHAAKERERRAARKAAEGRADEIQAERTAADDFIDAAIAAHPSGATFTEQAQEIIEDPEADRLAAAIIDGTVSFEDAATALLSGASFSQVNANLAEMDSITLYRNVKDELTAKKVTPDLPTPHLDELNARKGRKVLWPPAKATADRPARTERKRPAAHPLFEQATAARKAANNKRGKAAVKLTAEELTAVSSGSWSKAWELATSAGGPYAAEEGGAV
jgi:hypothetical protein